MREFATRAQGSKKRGHGADKVAQNVQRSAYSDASNYRKNQQQAQALIDRMSASCPGGCFATFLDAVRKLSVRGNTASHAEGWTSWACSLVGRS